MEQFGRLLTPRCPFVPQAWFNSGSASSMKSLLACPLGDHAFFSDCLRSMFTDSKHGTTCHVVHLPHWAGVDHATYICSTVFSKNIGVSQTKRLCRNRQPVVQNLCPVVYNQAEDVLRLTYTRVL